jgi:hypothetical protein
LSAELIREGEALAERLKGRRGWRVVVGLVERVRDLEFQVSALAFLLEQKSDGGPINAAPNS